MNIYSIVGMAAMAIVLVNILLSVFKRKNNTLSVMSVAIVSALLVAGLRYTLHH